MKEIIEYDGKLYLVDDMINFSHYGSNVKDLLYCCIEVTKLPNKIEFCEKDYIKIRVNFELTKSNINSKYIYKSVKIKDGQLYYKYKLEKD